ncbi:MAG TPA: hypothetical protein VEI03_19470 [Stellaceae bacterium]|nr:hypothetical protein [Stellaceae bacterium]
MTTNETATQELQKVEELTRHYLNQGYRVIREPKGDQLPAFLQGFSPDLIAQKGSDNLIIEVKRRLSPHDQNYWRALSEVVAREPGWKFQIVLMDLDDIEWRPPSELPTPSALKARLKEVSTLQQNKQVGAALLLLWSVFEAAARHHLAKLGLPPTERTPSIALVKRLLAEGIIDDDDYGRVVASLADRNVLAHGFFQQHFPSSSIADLMTVTRQLIGKL